MRLVTGLAAAAIFAQGTYDWMVAGGFVFLFSMLLDRADGELARQTRQMSLTGHRYDLVADGLASIATFISLGLGLSQTNERGALWFGVLAGIGIGALFFELNVLKIASSCGYDLFGGRITVDPDDAMIFVPVLIWCHLAAPMVIVAAVVTLSASIVLGVLSFLRKRNDAITSDVRIQVGKAGL
jgi:archaetidylinositol phosphate synthase